MKMPAAIAAALVLLAFALSACGEVVLDAGKTEDQLRAEYERGDVSVAAVECPSDVEVEAGQKFDCTVTAKGGASTEVTLRIVNEDADLEIVDPGQSLEDLSANK